MRYVIFTATLILILAAGLFAQQTGTPDSSGGKNEVARADKGPVEIPPMTEQAVRYYKSGTALWIFDNLWGLLIPALFLFTGFSARIRDWAQKLGRKWFFVVAIYFLVFSILNFLINLPIAYYEEFVRQHEYGLSNQLFAKWFSDSLKGLLVGVIMGCLFLWVPYLLLKKSPTRWWLYTSILCIPFLFFVMLISPVWIDPLFNKFGPMKDKVLEQKILDLASRAGIEGSRVYEVDKSVDTKTVNAYVTGFMGTKRIVLWDTTLAKLNEKEILVVMGHEMGHYVLGHVYKGIFFFSLLILVTLYAAYRLSGSLLAKYKDLFGFDQLSDIASLPLILLLVGALSLVILPIAFTFSRSQEHEADRFGLEITKDNYDAAMAFVKLQQENLSNPSPGLIMKLWRWSHPPLGERIQFSNEYRPWERGQPLKYGDLIKK